MKYWPIYMRELTAEVLTLLGIADAYPEPQRLDVLRQAQVLAATVRQQIGNRELLRLAVITDRKLKVGE